MTCTDAIEMIPCVKSLVPFINQYYNFIVKHDYSADYFQKMCRKFPTDK